MKPKVGQCVSLDDFIWKLVPVNLEGSVGEVSADSVSSLGEISAETFTVKDFCRICVDFASEISAEIFEISAELSVS